MGPPKSKKGDWRAHGVLTPTRLLKKLGQREAFDDLFE